MSRSLPAFAALLAVLAFATALRLPFVGKAVTGDELALLDDRGFRDIVLDYETRANPPLHRLLVNLPFRDSRTRLRAGEALSFASTLIAVALAFAIGRRVTESVIGGAAGALLVAVSPTLLEESTRFRGYAPWLAVALWQWHALARLLEERPANDRSAAIGFAIASALLPWLHYASVLLVAVEALALWVAGRRRLLPLLAPAGVATVLLAWVIHASRYAPPIPPTGAPGEQLWHLAGSGLTSLRGGPWWCPDGLRGAIIALSLLAALARWRQEAPLVRVAAVAWLGMLGAVVTLAAFRQVRPPGALWLLPMATVFIVAAPRLLPSAAVRAAGLASLAALAILLGEANLPGPELGDGVVAVVERWPELRRRAAGRSLRLVPDYAGQQFLFTIAGRSIRDVPPDPGCGEGRFCWTQDGIPIVAGGRLPEGPTDALFVIFHEPGARPPATPCGEERWHPYAVVVDCRQAALPQTPWNSSGPQMSR